MLLRQVIIIVAAALFAGQTPALAQTGIGPAEVSSASRSPADGSSRAPIARPAGPFPQIETAMHIGPVSGAVTDAAKRIAITTGQDATARVWSLPDLRLLRVLRPPIGWELGPQVALTPDGRTAALASGAGALIYEVATGDIIQKIPLAQSWGRVNSLAISPDGRRLVIGRGPNGDGCWLFVFGLDGKFLWKKCGSSRAVFPEVALALAFAPDGHLAAASEEDSQNSLTLFNPSGNVLSTVLLHAMASFDGLAFSPVGRHLAIAYNSVDHQIEIRNGMTLALTATPDTHDLASLYPTLAWSADGEWLYAAGMRHKNNPTKFGDRTPIFAWGNNGMGPRREDLSAQYRHHSVAILPDGKVFLISNSRTPVVLNRNDSQFAKAYPDGADFSTRPSEDPDEDYLSRFSLSRDGAQIEFATSDLPGEWLYVDTRQPSVSISSHPHSNFVNWTLHGAQFSKGSLEKVEYRSEIRGAEQNPQAPGSWFFQMLRKEGIGHLIDRDKAGPEVWTVNGHMLKLVDLCEPKSSAPPRTSVANGRVVTVTCGGLLMANKLNGDTLWNVVAGGAGNLVTRLNQSPDGRLVITAHADGTIRWRRASDGRLLLTLYIDRTGERWIFFTPSGYYYASSDADKFVGWLIGDHGQAPDFFAVGQFKEHFRRRDVVTRVLDTLDESEALRQLNIAPAGDGGLIAAIGGDLPPVVAVVSPADNSQIVDREVMIEYALRSPSGREVQDLTVQVDGRPVAVTASPPPLPRNQPGTEVRGHVAVPIPPDRTVTVSLIAATDSGRRSQPAWLRVRGAAAEHTAASSDQHGRLFALLIGAREYSHLQGKILPSTVRDATELADLLRAPVQRRLYSAVDVRLLTDDTVSPTRAAILDGLRWLREHATQPNDVGLLFVASHGYGDPDDRNSFWIVPTDGDLKKLNETAISGKFLLDQLRHISGRVTLFLDACQAGGVISPDMDLFAADAANPWVGVFIYASSARDQFSYEDEKSHHGNFTLALIDALHGEGVTVRDGFIETDDLRSFVRQHFRDTDGESHRQTPVVQGPPLAPDFPLFAVVPPG